MITWAFAFKYYWYNQKMVTLNQKPESKFNLGTHPPYCFSKSSPFENILTLFKQLITSLWSLVWGPSYSDWIDSSLFLQCLILVEVEVGAGDVNWFTLSVPGSVRVSDLLIPVWRVAAGSPCDTWHVTGVVWPAPARLQVAGHILGTV